jgi:hypothetical protein
VFVSICGVIWKNDSKAKAHVLLIVATERAALGYPQSSSAGKIMEDHGTGA